MVRSDTSTHLAKPSIKQEKRRGTGVEGNLRSVTAYVCLSSVCLPRGEGPTRGPATTTAAGGGGAAGEHWQWNYNERRNSLRLPTASQATRSCIYLSISLSAEVTGCLSVYLGFIYNYRVKKRYIYKNVGKLPANKGRMIKMKRKERKTRQDKTGS